MLPIFDNDSYEQAEDVNTSAVQDNMQFMACLKKYEPLIDKLTYAYIN